MNATPYKRNLSPDSDLQYVKGVGPALAALFGRNGYRTVGDFTKNYPRAYEDQRAARLISTLQDGDIVSLKAYVVNVSNYNMGASSRKVYDIMVRDQSGQIRCKFFRVPYKGYFERFKPGTEIRVVGKVTNYRGRLEFHHPDMRDIDPEEEIKDALIPIYIEHEGMSSVKIQKFIQNCFLQLKEWGEDKFPESIMKKHNLVTHEQAMHEIHHPNMAEASLYNQYKSSAHRRIIFEEFFWLELYLASKKSNLKKEKGIVVKNESKLSEALIKSLPFELT
ncbi:MAG: ATP-dependent DNA helicase RecG, partial [Bdellovibrionaceae bacterium]|nr:ATP-dependent DNA helicase RecG [Pseudobdellovibrionaceae bacterium]